MELGRYSRLVPRDVRENVEWRHWMIGKIRERPGLRVGVKRMSEDDPLYWINAWVFQFNPNAVEGGVSLEVGPFVTWDFQDEMLREILWCVKNRKDMVIEKSREMGATWLCLLAMGWMYLWQRNKKFLMISKSAEAVDDADEPDSLFWKLDFVFRYLPRWMTEGRLNRLSMRYSNPAMNSFITGAATVGTSGASRRATAIFIDEFSLIRDAKGLYTSTSDTSKCRIFNGTHKGVGTMFHEICTKGYVKKLVVHWSKHPDKKAGAYRYDVKEQRVVPVDTAYQYPADFRFDQSGLPAGGPFPGLRSPWYDEEVKRRNNDPKVVAEDLDINPSGSSDQFFNAMLVHEHIQEFARPPEWEGDVVCDVETGEFTRFSSRPDGHLRLWCGLDKDGLPAADEKGYAIAADVSAGQGATPSCLSIGRVSTGEKIGEYANAFADGKKLAGIAVALARVFKSVNDSHAHIAWEHAGAGNVFKKAVLSMGHRNVYRRPQRDNLLDQPTELVGWVTNDTNLLILLEEYRSALFDRKFINHSEPALMECLNFRYTENGVEHSNIKNAAGDPSGAKVNHADMAVADALMWAMIRQCGGGEAVRLEKKSGKELQKNPPWGSVAWHMKREAQERQENVVWS